MANPIATEILPEILERIRSAGYAVFTQGNFNLNLFGIRHPDRVDGTFNDMLGCAYKEDGRWIVRYWTATTDAGLTYRETPMNPKGTAVLAAGQYRGAYKLGLHRGSYEALVQRGAPVIVHRDNNRDQTIDVWNVPTEEGYFGINIHRASLYGEQEEVGKWSAGCQVFASLHDFREMVKLAKSQMANGHGNSFTYTLLD
tara:strand:+ start:232 stop:828 length:597 start_codon:yes stop_codon:yes gene_type:complete